MLCRAVPAALQALQCNALAVSEYLSLKLGTLRQESEENLRYIVEGAEVTGGWKLQLQVDRPVLK